MILALLVFSLQFPAVQTYASKRVAGFLSKELNAEIGVGAVYFKPFSSLTIHELNVKDPAGNRIAAMKRAHARLNLRQLLQNKVEISEIKLTEAYADFQRYQDSSNFKFLIDYFSPEKKEEDPNKKKIQLSVGRIEFENCHFLYVDQNKAHHDRGIDYGNVELTGFSGVFDDIRLDSILNKAKIEQLRFKEKSGFELKNLTATSSISSKHIELENLDLKTNRSTLKRLLRLDFDSFKDFSDFIPKVRITADIANSFVDSKDIEYFAESLKKVKFTTHIQQANISGTVANIAARNVKFTTQKKTSLAGNFTIKGLPHIDKTIFDFQNITLESATEESEYLVRELSNRSSFNLPEQVHKLNNIRFNGDFKGLYNDFEVDGVFATDIGEFRTKSNIDFKKNIVFQGNLTSNSLDIGEFLNTEELGTTQVNVQFDGKNSNLADLVLNFDAKLGDIEFRQKRLNALSATGQLKNKKLDVDGWLHDPAVYLDFDAEVDWNALAPQYHIASNIEKFDLKAFNLIKKDSVILSNTLIHADMTGDNINNITGVLTTKEINLHTQQGNFVIYDVKFGASGNENDRNLHFESNVLDAEITGIIDIPTLVPYFRSLAMKYAPAIGFERQAFNDQNFDLRIAIKSFDPVSTFLDPTFILDDGAYLSANFSSDNYLGNFIFYSPNITYKGLRLNNLAINENTDQQALKLNIQADRLHFSDSVYVENISIDNILANDSLNFKIAVADDTASNQIRLNGNILFEQDKPAFIDFKESTIIANAAAWSIVSDNKIRISKGKFYFDQFKLLQDNQSIELNGTLSDEQDKINVHFNRFGLASLDAFIRPLGIRLIGELNGQVEVTSAFKSPFFKANISTTPIIYNDLPVGQLALKADYAPDQEQIDISLNLLDELNRGLKLGGIYYINDKENPIRLSGTINQMELVLFQPFLRTIVKDLNGKLNGDLNIRGNFRSPKLSGTAKFPQANFNVIYLNTQYSLTDQSAVFEDNIAYFNNLKLRDIKNNEAVGNGFLDLNVLKEPNLDVEIAANNFMVLNTTYKENNLYYGTAFASGNFKFKGRTSALNIDIDAVSNQNTVIHIPFNSAMTVSDSDFIYFVEKDSSKASTRESQYFMKGMTMNMDLKITPEATMNLQTDIGSLKSIGNGEVTLHISSLGDFEMFGDYSLTSGSFHFTAQDFINKYFDIKEGGTIRWTGNPENATINIVALYQQRTSIGALYNAAGRPGQDERVLAQADMIISGTLNQPDIRFDLNFPLTPYVKDELQAYLSDANNVNQQALSLIVRRSFTAANSANEFGTEVNNTLLSAGTEIAFNQLNTIISQSLNVNFLDLNIRSLNDASASLRFFNDRLVLTGGISDRRNLQTTDLTFFSNRIATDAEVTYRIRRDGSLMLRAYNRLNTRNILFTPTDDYINAVGLVYRQEFDTFQEFFRRLMTFHRKKTDDLVKPDSSETQVIKKITSDKEE